MCADVVDPATRSRMMARIRGKDTAVEVAVRRQLHSLGYRFRLHRKDLPGRPDIVLPRYRAAVFVHGCFWHRHAGCIYATNPATRPAFWQAKFEANVRRDTAAVERLMSGGWSVSVIWECAVIVDGLGSIDLARLLAWLDAQATTSSPAFLEIP